MFTARRFILLIIIVSCLVMSAQAAKAYGSINLTGELGTKEPYISNYIAVIFFVMIAVIFLLFFWKKKRKPFTPEQEEITSEPPEKTTKSIEYRIGELPDDLREMFDLIMEKGGRMTQKEIRKDAKYGEAKVSLMLADLENRGLIKKIKKGRSNIIIAENMK